LVTIVDGKRWLNIIELDQKSGVLPSKMLVMLTASQWLTAVPRKSPCRILTARRSHRLIAERSEQRSSRYTIRYGGTRIAMVS
jgi:hypothetical protein